MLAVLLPIVTTPFFAGNSDLTNASTHNLRLNYRSFNLFDGSSIFGGVNYRKTADQVNRNTIFQPRSVVSSSSSINSTFDNESLTAYGNLSKTFKKITARLGGNFTYAKSYQSINFIENTNESFVKGINTRIGTNFTKAPNLSLNYRLSFVDQKNSSRASDIKTVTHAPSIDFDAYLWESVTLRSDFSYNEQRQGGSVLNSYKILNAKIAYRKDRDAKWEYELVGSNLLATGSNASVNQGVVSFNVRETFILPRFISFRVRYQL